ncbi:MAG: AMP-binding protein, partial [Ketobacteraceae bacterium]|nr:AMP-binding protein [Ketobacteraceae bacterium]
MTINQNIPTSGLSLQALNQRNIDYRFDLERDIPWDIPLDEGRFFTDEFFYLFGFNPDLLKDSTRRGQLEWCWALAISRIFVFFEKDIIGLIRDSRNRISQTPSSALLIEEEVKHVRLFRRLGEKLEQAQPQWVAAFDECYRDPQAYNIPFSQRDDLERIEQHQFLIWLYTLFFENFTVYLHDKLIPFADCIHPLWYRAHECHRNEEAEHVRTDQAYLEACALSPAELKSLGKEFFLLLSFNYQNFFGLDTCERFMKRLHPASGSWLSCEEFTEIPFFQEVLNHPVFVSTRQWTPALVDYYGNVYAGTETTASETGEKGTLPWALETLAQSDPLAALNIVGFDGALHTLTYGELAEQARQKARQLIAAFPGQRYVLLYFPEIGETLTWFWASIYSGKVPVILAFAGAPGNDSEEARRLRKISVALPDALLLTPQEHLPGLAALHNEQPQLETAHLASVESLDGADLSHVPLPVVKASDEALIQFSSGSTGDPKGISLTHGNILANAQQMIAACQGTPEDRFLNWMPLHHDMGMIGYHLTPIINGSSQYQIHPVQFMKSPGLWPALVTRYGITKSGITNSALKNIVRWAKSAARKARAQQMDLSHLTSVIVGAEPIQVATMDDVEQFLAPMGLNPDCLTPAYGMAEASLAITFKPHHSKYRAQSFARRTLMLGSAVSEATGSTGMTMISLGLPVPDLQLEIVDEHNGLLPDGHLGYVRFRGPNVSRGYWKGQAFVAAVDDAGWFRSRDLGMLIQGELYLMGRADEVFYAGGKNYFLNDIDALVEALDCVKTGGCAAVVDPFSHQGAADVVVFADVLGAGDDTVLENLRKIHNEIQRQMGVAVGRCVSLPRREYLKTTSGKIKRIAMATAYASGNWQERLTFSVSAPQAEARPPADSTLEALVADLWSDVLGIVITAQQWQHSFQDLGGTSLKALRIHDGLEQVFQRPLNPSWLITKNTIQQMADALRAKGFAVPDDVVSDDVAPVSPELGVATPPQPASAEDAQHSAGQQPVSDTDIAVVGVGLRYPGASDLATLAQRMEAGETTFAPMSDKRWRLIAGNDARLINGQRPWGAFLEDIELFDGPAFGVSDELATGMDPQTRLFLQMSLEAIGQARLTSSRVGVFAAGGDNEYGDRLMSPSDYNQSTLGGTLQNMLAAQVSRA